MTLISLLKKIVNRKSDSIAEHLIKKGNLKVGKNSDISSLYIEILHHMNNCTNIEIGEDCKLMGSLTVYSDTGKIKIGDRVFIGPDTKLISYNEVVVEDDVMISWGCTIMDTNAHSLKSEERKDDVINWSKGWQYKDWSGVESQKIIIERKSWIGFNSIVMKGVKVAEGSVVAAGSVVTKSTEPYTIVGGNPAAFLKKTS